MFLLKVVISYISESNQWNQFYWLISVTPKVHNERILLAMLHISSYVLENDKIIAIQGMGRSDVEQQHVCQSFFIRDNFDVSQGTEAAENSFLRASRSIYAATDLHVCQ